MRTIRIYRSLLVNEGENINLENVGRSWSTDRSFVIEHAERLKLFAGKYGMVVLQGEVSDASVCWDNTLFAMDCRDWEMEVVLKDHEIEFTVYDVFDVSHIEEGTVMVGRIGSNNFEDYCNTYEGELTKEDFFSII